MRARRRDVGLLNLPKIALSPIKSVFLFFGHPALLLKERVIATFHLHQVVDHRSKLMLECPGIQTPGNLSDAWLHPGFRGLIVFHLAPNPGGDGSTFFFCQKPPLLEQI